MARRHFTRNCLQWLCLNSQLVTNIQINLWQLTYGNPSMLCPLKTVKYIFYKKKYPPVKTESFVLDKDTCWFIITFSLQCGQYVFSSQRNSEFSILSMKLFLEEQKIARLNHIACNYLGYIP